MANTAKSVLPQKEAISKARAAHMQKQGDSAGTGIGAMTEHHANKPQAASHIKPQASPPTS